MTISDGPEGVEGVEAPSAEDDGTVAAVPAFGVIEDETDDRTPAMLVDNKPAECGAEEACPMTAPLKPTGSGDGSGEAIGDDELNNPAEGRGVESRRLRMRNFV